MSGGAEWSVGERGLIVVVVERESGGVRATEGSEREWSVREVWVKGVGRIICM